MNGNTYRSPVGPTLRRTFITFACGAGKVSAPGFSACSTANLMGTPLVPKSLRTVRQVSPAPVSYSLQCVSKHSMRFLQHYNSGQMTPVHTVTSLFPAVWCSLRRTCRRDLSSRSGNGSASQHISRRPRCRGRGFKGPVLGSVRV